MELAKALLIVDDNSVDRAIYCRYLQCDVACTYFFIEAETGQAGLEAYQHHRPDVILLDYRLPDFDGLEFLQRLEPIAQPMPLVIMLTGQGNEDLAVQAMKAGAFDYLVKRHITESNLQSVVYQASKTAETQQAKLQQAEAAQRQFLQRERLVMQIAQEIRRSLDLEEILTTTAQEVRQFLQTDRVLLFRLHPEGGGTVVTESVSPAYPAILSTNIDDPCFTKDYLEHYRQGRVAAIANLRDAAIEPCHLELLSQFQVQANLIVPILVHSQDAKADSEADSISSDPQLWGLLIAHHCAGPRDWQSIEIELLQQLATQVAIAIQQAELYQQVQSELAERRRAEAILRQNEEATHQRLLEIEAIYNTAPIGLCFVDTELRFVRMNDHFAAINGLPAAQQVGQTIGEILPDLAEQLEPLLQQTLETGEPLLNLEFHGKNQTHPEIIRDWIASYYPLKNAIGQVLGVNITVNEITARKQVENAIRQSEQQVRRVLNSLFSFVGVMTPEGILIEANRTALEAANLQPEDVLEQPFAETYWWSYSSTIQAQLNQAIQQAAQGEIVRYDVQVRLSNDRFIMIDFAIVPLLDANGQVEYLIPSGIDITDRRLAEQTLRETLQRFTFMVENAPLGVIEWDRNFRVSRWSAEAERIFGWRAEEVLGKRFDEWSFIFEADLPAVQNIVARLSQGHQERTAFNRTYTKSGTVVYCEWYNSTLLDDSGEFVALLSLVQDISQRRQTEMALQQSEERYRYLAELIPQLVWTANAEGMIIDINQRWQNFTGLTLAEIQTQGWPTIIHPDDLASVSQDWAVAQQSGNIYQSEGRIRRADGVYRWHLHQAVPLRNEQGEVIKWFGTATDIEDQKQLEQQLDRILQQEQAARAEAEQASRIKDEFLAVLSHELRTPLNPILGWAKLLQTSQLSEEKTRQALETIERNARLQVQLVDDLLDISSILRGKLILNLIPTKLVEPVRAALETVRLSAEAKSIHLEIQISAVPTILGDPGRLQQVVWNLLSNAIKFTPQGGHVTVKIGQAGGYAELQVTDTGKGISSNFLPHIFERFRQQDSSITRQFGGLGLGLALTRQLVEAHGGTIAVISSGEGQGATFTVRLPIMPTLPPTFPALLTNQTPDLQGVRVLAVDDEPDSLELLKFLLEQEGAVVTGVTSAAAALQSLAQAQFDVLLSDIGMPETNGYSLLQQIRTLPIKQGRNIPTIALTAYASEQDEQQALAIGYECHLPKPIDPENLIAAIARLVRGQPGKEEDETMNAER